jgi:hypothetical protein
MSSDRLMRSEMLPGPGELGHEWPALRPGELARDFPGYWLGSATAERARRGRANELRIAEGGGENAR